MKGHGVSGGALTVINAIATGFGSAFGIGLQTSAEVVLTAEPGVTLQVNGCDITRSALAKIEVGQRQLYTDEIIAIKKILNVSFDEILNIQ